LSNFSDIFLKLTVFSIYPDFLKKKMDILNIKNSFIFNVSKTKIVMFGYRKNMYIDIGQTNFDLSFDHVFVIKKEIVH
jgi:hypothetical protein